MINDFTQDGGRQHYFGVYPAIVTALVDPESLGRIEVRFPWLGQEGDSEVRAWATLLSPYADDDQGFQALPEVDSQVVVAFERAEKPLEVVLGRGAGQRNRTAGADNGPALLSLSMPEQGLQGIHPSDQMVRLRLGAVPAVKKSMEKLWLLSGLLFQSITGLATAKVSSAELVGPVYLFHISTEAAIESQTSLVYLLAFVSASLFFFNLLPLPILDGGQIVLAFLQKLLRRPLTPRSLKLLTHASLVWLFSLLAAATLNDLVRLVKL